jgi:hypothetical protein
MHYLVDLERRILLKLTEIKNVVVILIELVWPAFVQSTMKLLSP